MTFIRWAIPIVVIITLLIGISARPASGQQTQGTPFGDQLVKEFDLPTRGAGPLAITADTTGRIWFTENNVSGIGAFEPSTGRWSEYTVPSLPKNASLETLSPIGAQMFDIKTDAQGNVWFTSEVGSQVIEFQPHTAKFTAYAIGGSSIKSGNASEPFHILMDGDIVWVSELNGRSIGMLNTTTGVVKQFFVSNEATVGGMTFGPSGLIWFVVPEGNYKVGVFNPSTGKLQLFERVVVDNNSTYVNGPSLIELDYRGRMWVTDHASNTIYSFDPLRPQNDSWTAYWTSPRSGNLNGSRSEPFGLAIDGQGNVWFTEPAANRIAVLRPSHGTMTEYTVPTPNSVPDEIAIDGEGRAWFTELSGNKIGMIDPATSPPFTIDTNEKNIVVAQGRTVPVEITVNEAPNYNPGSALKVWLTGIPYQYVKLGTSAGEGGGNTFEVTLQASNSLSPGTYTATVSLSSPTITQSVVVDVTVTEAQAGWTTPAILFAAAVVVTSLALASFALWRRRNAGRRT